jgi:hypothetical protein
MLVLIRLLLAILASPFKSKSRLEAENAALRQQLVVLRRKAKGRARLTNADRWFFVLLYQCLPSILEVLTIVRPETLARWHRVGFRHYWHWKSRRRGGRPQVQTALRALIRRMSVENPLWGAPRIHGELLKLGEAHLRRILKSYARYYNEVRTHWSLNKDAPVSRVVQRIGIVKSHAVLGGPHHHYVRI